MIDEKVYYLIYKEFLQINKKKKRQLTHLKTWEERVIHKERNSSLTNMLNVTNKGYKVKL